jgi:nitrite reductase (NO-forming)
MKLTTLTNDRIRIMASRTLLPAVAVALLSATAMPVFADATHTHPAANGTAAAPLDITRAATDLAPPVGARGHETIKVNLDTAEVNGSLADGASYHYWTFNRKVPGPFIRARVGDTVEVELTNLATAANVIAGISTPLRDPEEELTRRTPHLARRKALVSGL